jgi:predicted nucleic-acid-binding protein
VIGLDTNVLVRYLVQDDPVQSALAVDVLERRASATEPAFISVVTVAETVWVLDRHYRFGREQIANAIEGLLCADVIAVESEPEVFVAAVALREGRGEFADALIGALCIKAGCGRVLSFDRKALRLPRFEHP